MPPGPRHLRSRTIAARTCTAPTTFHTPPPTDHPLLSVSILHRTPRPTARRMSRPVPAHKLPLHPATDRVTVPRGRAMWQIIRLARSQDRISRVPRAQATTPCPSTPRHTANRLPRDRTAAAPTSQTPPTAPGETLILAMPEPRPRIVLRHPPTPREYPTVVIIGSRTRQRSRLPIARTSSPRQQGGPKRSDPLNGRAIVPSALTQARRRNGRPCRTSRVLCRCNWISDSSTRWTGMPPSTA